MHSEITDLALRNGLLHLFDLDLTEALDLEKRLARRRVDGLKLRPGQYSVMVMEAVGLEGDSLRWCSIHCS